MTIKQDYLHEMCNGFTSFVENMPLNLTIKYLFHRRGQRNDAIELETSFFQAHPAGNTALNMLRQEQKTQNSLFHGLAVETTHTLMGLKENKNVLGIITINLDHHDTTESALHEAYHLGWMAIDTAKMLQHPQYNKFKSGPLVPKRDSINTAKSCLQADIFSTLCLASQGFDNMIKDIAKQRGMDTMLPKINAQPWNYPYPLAFETTQHAWKKLINVNDKKYDFIETPLEFAKSITETIPEESYQQWWDFCKPAQAMAWHNDTPEYILSAALYTSENPIIKVTACLLETCTDIETSKDVIHNKSFNAFISHQDNKAHHDLSVEETFETTLERGLEEQSIRPFIEVANKQNRTLAEGNVFGWCASALQAAAKTFETAKTSSIEEKRNLIKLGFEGSKKEIKYDSLLALGEQIIEQRKQGKIVTMEEVNRLAQAQATTTFVSSSIEQTINDPAYQKNLDAVQDMDSVYIPESSQNAPKAQPTHAQEAAPKAAPQIATAMGGGMMGGTSGIPSQTVTQSTTEDTKKAE